MDLNPDAVVEPDPDPRSKKTPKNIRFLFVLVNFPSINLEKKKNSKLNSIFKIFYGKFSVFFPLDPDPCRRSPKMQILADPDTHHWQERGST